MKKSIESYLEPFKDIIDFLDTIEERRISFYNSFRNEFFGQRVTFHNKEVRILKDAYNEGETNFNVYTFENEVKFHFLGLINNSQILIYKGLDISSISYQSSRFLDEIELQYIKLLKHPQINSVYYLRAQIQLIASDIAYYRKMGGISEKHYILKHSPFYPKKELEDVFFRLLFDIAIRFKLIHEESNKEDFIDVFTSDETLNKITFHCNNPLIVVFFETIAPLFNNLTPTSIEESKRFYNKQNRLFNRKLYNSTKNRMKDNFEIKELHRSLFKLISSCK